MSCGTNGCKTSDAAAVAAGAPAATGSALTGAAGNGKKPAWQMSKAEWLAGDHRVTRSGKDSYYWPTDGERILWPGTTSKKKVIEGQHRFEIQKALRDGKPVTESVLAEYPDLAAEVQRCPQCGQFMGQNHVCPVKSGLDQALQVVEFKLVCDALSELSNLESQSSPENFWMDGERPNTAAAQREWQKLLRMKREAERHARRMMDRLSADELAEFGQLLPDGLRFMAQMLGYKLPPKSEQPQPAPAPAQPAAPAPAQERRDIPNAQIIEPKGRKAEVGLTILSQIPRITKMCIGFQKPAIIKDGVMFCINPADDDGFIKLDAVGLSHRIVVRYDVGADAHRVERWRVKGKGAPVLEREQDDVYFDQFDEVLMAFCDQMTPGPDKCGGEEYQRWAQHLDGKARDKRGITKCDNCGRFVNAEGEGHAPQCGAIKQAVAAVRQSINQVVAAVHRLDGLEGGALLDAQRDVRTVLDALAPDERPQLLRLLPPEFRETVEAWSNEADNRAKEEFDLEVNLVRAQQIGDIEGMLDAYVARGQWRAKSNDANTRSLALVDLHLAAECAAKLLGRTPHAGVDGLASAIGAICCGECGNFISADNRGHKPTCGQVLACIQSWLQETSEAYDDWHFDGTTLTVLVKGRDEPERYTLEDIGYPPVAAPLPSAAPDATPAPPTPRELSSLSDDEYAAMRQAAVDWQYLTVLAGRMALKSQLDQWLMQRYGLTQDAAHTISNSTDDMMYFSTGEGRLHWSETTAERPAPDWSAYPDLAQAYGQMTAAVTLPTPARPRKADDLTDEERRIIKDAAIDGWYLMLLAKGGTRPERLQQWLMARYNLTEAAAGAFIYTVDQSIFSDDGSHLVEWDAAKAGRPSSGLDAYPDLAQLIGQPVKCGECGRYIGHDGLGHAATCGQAKTADKLTALRKELDALELSAAGPDDAQRTGQLRQAIEQTRAQLIQEVLSPDTNVPPEALFKASDPEAQRYIKSLRGERRSYAQQYAAWLEAHELGDEPKRPAGMSHMSAQGVRLHLGKMARDKAREYAASITVAEFEAVSAHLYATSAACKETHRLAVLAVLDMNNGQGVTDDVLQDYPDMAEEHGYIRCAECGRFISKTGEGHKPDCGQGQQEYRERARQSWRGTDVGDVLGVNSTSTTTPSPMPQPVSDATTRADAQQPLHFVTHETQLELQVCRAVSALTDDDIHSTKDWDGEPVVKIDLAGTDGYFIRTYKHTMGRTFAEVVRIGADGNYEYGAAVRGLSVYTTGGDAQRRAVKALVKEAQILAPIVSERAEREQQGFRQCSRCAGYVNVVGEGHNAGCDKPHLLCGACGNFISADGQGHKPGCGQASATHQVEPVAATVSGDAVAQSQAIATAKQWAQEQDARRGQETGNAEYSRYFMAVDSLASGKYEDVCNDIRAGRLTYDEAMTIAGRLRDLGALNQARYEHYTEAFGRVENKRVMLQQAADARYLIQQMNGMPNDKELALWLRRRFGDLSSNDVNEARSSDNARGSYGHDAHGQLQWRGQRPAPSWTDYPDLAQALGVSQCPDCGNFVSSTGRGHKPECGQVGTPLLESSEEIAPQTSVPSPAPAFDHTAIKTEWRTSPFVQGARVVLANGRHGAITDVRVVTMTSLFGGPRTEELSGFTVKTDNGATQYVYAGDVADDASTLQLETESLTHVAHDPVWEGEPMEPWDLLRRIMYDRRIAQNKRGAARRAIKPENQQAHKRQADEYDAKASQMLVVLEAWAKDNPDEARAWLDSNEIANEQKPLALELKAKLFPDAPASQSASVVAASANPYAGNPYKASANFTTFKGRPSVEIRFPDKPPQRVLDDLHRAGFDWSGPQRKWYAYGDQDTQDVARKITGCNQCPKCGRFVSASGEGHRADCGQQGQVVAAMAATAAPDVTQPQVAPPAEEPQPAAPRPTLKVNDPAVEAFVKLLRDPHQIRYAWAYAAYMESGQQGLEPKPHKSVSSASAQSIRYRLTQIAAEMAKGEPQPPAAPGSATPSQSPAIPPATARASQFYIAKRGAGGQEFVELVADGRVKSYDDVQSVQIDIEGWRDREFIAYADLTTGNWTVTDARSGLMVANDKTLPMTLDRAQLRLRGRWPSQLGNLPVSPRYLSDSGKPAAQATSTGGGQQQCPECGNFVGADGSGHKPECGKAKAQLAVAQPAPDDSSLVTPTTPGLPRYRVSHSETPARSGRGKPTVTYTATVAEGEHAGLAVTASSQSDLNHRLASAIEFKKLEASLPPFKVEGFSPMPRQHKQMAAVTDGRYAGVMAIAETREQAIRDMADEFQHYDNIVRGASSEIIADETALAAISGYDDGDPAPVISQETMISVAKATVWINQQLPAGGSNALKAKAKVYLTQVSKENRTALMGTEPEAHPDWAREALLMGAEILRESGAQKCPTCGNFVAASGAGHKPDCGQGKASSVSSSAAEPSVHATVDEASLQTSPSTETVPQPKHPQDVGFTARYEWHGDIQTPVWRHCGEDAGVKQRRVQDEQGVWHTVTVHRCSKCGVSTLAPKVERGSRVQWIGSNGETLTGAVRFVRDDGTASISCDNMLAVSGVPIGQIEDVNLNRLALLESAPTISQQETSAPAASSSTSAQRASAATAPSPAPAAPAMPMPAQTVEDNPDAKPLKVYPVPGSGASPTAVKRVELMREDKAGNRYNMVFADGHVQRGIVAKTWQEAFKLGASTRKGGAK